MKPNTYTKLYAHCVFTPNGRESLLQDSIRISVHKYIYGILSEKKCYPVGINGTKDHVHILFGFGPAICIADLMRDIKRSSALFINSEFRSYLKFSWQEGYGAFSVGYRELDKVYHYILNQEDHHITKRFRDEYLELLIDNGVDYKKEYIFEFYDGD
jgi:REP element-mobilizing transposase RayT